MGPLGRICLIRPSGPIRPIICTPSRYFAAFRRRDNGIGTGIDDFVEFFGDGRREPGFGSGELRGGVALPNKKDGSPGASDRLVLETADNGTSLPVALGT